MSITTLAGKITQMSVGFYADYEPADQRLALASLVPEADKWPARCFQKQPEDKGTFVLPVKQTLVKNARLMPGTRCMLMLLAGWIGKNQARCITTTRGVIGKHLGRSVRQIARYLDDARREGLLSWSYEVNRRTGMITGLKITLLAKKIFGGMEDRRRYLEEKAKNRTNSGVTKKAETNRNRYTPPIVPVVPDAYDELIARLEREYGWGLKPIS